MAKLQKHHGEKSRENLLSFKGNKSGKKRKPGRPRNKMKNINDLCKQSEKNVKYSGENILDFTENKRKPGRPRNKMKNINDLGKQSEKNVKYSCENLVNVFEEDKRTVLDLDEIVRDYIMRMSEFRAKNVQDICIIVCDDDHQNIGHDQQKGQKWEEPIFADVEQRKKNYEKRTLI